MELHEAAGSEAGSGKAPDETRLTGYLLGNTAVAYYRGLGLSVVLGSLIGYIAFFAFSQGSVIWVFISEIFPNRVRARGQALGSFTHWFWCAVVSWAFPMVAERSAGDASAIRGTEENGPIFFRPEFRRPVLLAPYPVCSARSSLAQRVKQL
jgi:hypothetical protein